MDFRIDDSRLRDFFFFSPGSLSKSPKLDGSSLITHSKAGPQKPVSVPGMRDRSLRHLAGLTFYNFKI